MIRWSVLLGSLLAMSIVSAQNDEPTAILGNMAGGTSGMSSAAVDFVFERATEMARASGREAPTIEHILLALLDDESVQEMLINQQIEAAAIRASLRYHLEITGVDPQTSDDPRVAEKLRNVMRRAALKNMISNRRELETTDIVVSILVEGDSYAAQLLSEQGLTADGAEDEALNNFLARQQEQSRRLEEMRTRISEESTRQAQSGAQSSNTLRLQPESGTGAAGGPRAYRLRVTSEDDEEEMRFKAAVSHDGQLDLHIESTPFETQFLASRVAALFEAIERDGRLRVELITEIDGQLRPISGFGGRAGAIFDDRNSMAGQRSGAL